MTPAEANYPIHDKEMLAIVSCIRHWRPELASIPFEVYSDHKNLGYFRKAQHLNERQLRWTEELANYNFKITHRPSKT